MSDPAYQPLEPASVKLDNPTTQGVSPKAVAATIAPLVIGLILMALDLGGVIEVDDALWIGLLGISPVSGAAAAQAKVGTVRKP